MIDPESEVFGIISKALRAAYPTIYISGEYNNVPPNLPSVSVEMMDNTPVNLDTSLKENQSQVMFEVNAYSNLVIGKKKQCKAIMDVVDKEFLLLNFVRIAYSPVPNMADSSIYRIVARYRAITDGTFFYRN